MSLFTFLLSSSSGNVQGARDNGSPIRIRRRISPPRARNSSAIASSTSLDHPPKTTMMMLYCRMSYRAVPSGGGEGHTTTNSLLLVIYKSRIYSIIFIIIFIVIVLTISILIGQEPPAYFENLRDFVYKHDYSIICYQIISADYTTHCAPLAKDREHSNGFE